MVDVVRSWSLDALLHLSCESLLRLVIVRHGNWWALKGVEVILLTTGVVRYLRIVSKWPKRLQRLWRLILALKRAALAILTERRYLYFWVYWFLVAKWYSLSILRTWFIETGIWPFRQMLTLPRSISLLAANWARFGNVHWYPRKLSIWGESWMLLLTHMGVTVWDKSQFAHLIPVPHTPHQ